MGPLARNAQRQHASLTHFSTAGAAIPCACFIVPYAATAFGTIAHNLWSQPPGHQPTPAIRYGARQIIRSQTRISKRRTSTRWRQNQRLKHRS